MSNNFEYIAKGMDKRFIDAYQESADNYEMAGIPFHIFKAHFYAKVIGLLITTGNIDDLNPRSKEVKVLEFDKSIDHLCGEAKRLFKEAVYEFK